VRLLRCSAVAVTTLALIGCRGATKPPVPSDEHKTAPATRETWTHELTEDEAWYEHPAQGRPPNGTLRKGTKVRVLNHAGSYTEVLSEQGVRGYVATASLRPF
jgi:hypothetical protein